MAEATSPVLSWLDEDELHDSVIDIMSEVKLTTGALVYPDGTPEQVLQIRMVQKLFQTQDKFMRLHQSEIAQAFYMNSCSMFPEKFRHYNRELNAEYIGDVLTAYIAWKDRFLYEKRAMINNLLNPPHEEVKVIITEDMWCTYINDDIWLTSQGRQSMIFNTSAKYCLLRKLGYIRIKSRANWWSWYCWALNQEKEQALRRPVHNEFLSITKRRRIRTIENVLKMMQIPTEEHGNYVAIMRREVYMFHIRCLVACGITDLFTQVKP